MSEIRNSADAHRAEKYVEQIESMLRKELPIYDYVANELIARMLTKKIESIILSAWEDGYEKGKESV